MRITSKTYKRKKSGEKEIDRFKPEDDEDRDGILGLDRIGRSSSINVEEHCLRRN